MPPHPEKTVYDGIEHRENGGGVRLRIGQPDGAARSRSQANRLIKLLEEFGDTHFTISQATRISPETYRAIAPAIRDNALHVDGEAIALTEENAPRIAAAVDALRRITQEKPSASEPAAPPVEVPAAEAGNEDPLEALNRRCTALIGELTALSFAVANDSTNRTILRSIVTLMQSRLMWLDEKIVAGPGGGGELAA